MLAQDALRSGSESVIGLKDRQEDRLQDGLWLPGIGTTFAVYDGHGGSVCADFLSKHLLKELSTAVRRHSSRSTWDSLERFRVRRCRKRKRGPSGDLSAVNGDGGETRRRQSCGVVALARREELLAQLSALMEQKEQIEQLVQLAQETAASASSPVEPSDVGEASADLAPLLHAKQELESMATRLRKELEALPTKPGEEEEEEREDHGDEEEDTGERRRSSDSGEGLERSDTQPVGSDKIEGKGKEDGSPGGIPGPTARPTGQRGTAADAEDQEEETEKLCGLIPDDLLVTSCVEAFKHTDRRFLQLASRKQLRDGSTACLVLVHGTFAPNSSSQAGDVPTGLGSWEEASAGGDGGTARLVIANLGDSRAVLWRGGQAMRLSEDHKPSRPDERRRIEQAGGYAVQVRGVWRVTNAGGVGVGSTSLQPRGAVASNLFLAVSRAFGDMPLKQPNPLVSSEPEVRVVPLRNSDLFAIVACDGIWDVLSDDDACEIAAEHWGDPKEAAKAVVRAAYAKGSADNMTAIVVQFGWQNAVAPELIRAAKEKKIHSGGEASRSSEPGGKVPADEGGFDMFS